MRVAITIDGMEIKLHSLSSAERQVPRASTIPRIIALVVFGVGTALGAKGCDTYLKNHGPELREEIWDGIDVTARAINEG